MVKKKTIKNTNSNIRKGKSKTKERNKIGNLSGGADAGTVGTADTAGTATNTGMFIIKYNEFFDKRLNLKRPDPEDSQTKPTQPTEVNQSKEPTDLENLEKKVNSYQELEYLKTFLTHEITYKQVYKQAQSAGSSVKREEIEEGKLYFINDVIDRNIDCLNVLNEESNADAEVSFVFKGTKGTVPLGTVKEFNRKFAFCISNLIGDQLLVEISNIIKKVEESLGEEKGNNYLNESKKSISEKLLQDLISVYQEVRDSLNKFSTLKNDEKYTKIKKKIGKGLTDDQVNTLIKFFMGMFFSTVLGLEMPQKLNENIKKLIMDKYASIDTEIAGNTLTEPDPVTGVVEDGQRGGGETLDAAGRAFKNFFTDDRISEYTTYLDKRLGRDTPEFDTSYENNNKIHDLEIYKYLYNFLIHDGTFFDLVPRKQMNRISIFFSDKFTVLRRHFLFYLCAFSRDRYEVLMTFFKSKKIRMKLFSNPFGNENSLKNFNGQLERYKSRNHPKVPDAITNEYLEECFKLFFPDVKNDVIGKELGMYSLFYQGSIPDDSVIIEEIFKNMTTSKSANKHYNSFIETSPKKLLSELGGENKFRLKAFFFYKGFDDSALKIAIQANKSVSETETFTLNLNKFTDIGGIKGGFFDVLDKLGDQLSFKLGIHNENKRNKFFYEVNEIVNRYRLFRCMVWMGIKVSTIAATHAVFAASSAASMATAEAEAAGQVANMIGIEQSVATEVATQGETVAQATIYLGSDETTGIVLSVLTVLATIGEMGRFSSSSGTGSSEASGGGFFSNSKYKELLYTADNELFKSESSGLLKQKNIKNIYNLYLELKNFDVTYCNDNDCGKIGKAATKGVLALGTKLSNNMTDIPCLYFTKLRLNYVRRKNEDINKEIEDTLSIKEFKDEPKPEPEPKSNNVNNIMLTGEVLNVVGDAMWWSFIGEGIAAAFA